MNRSTKVFFGSLSPSKRCIFFPFKAAVRGLLRIAGLALAFFAIIQPMCAAPDPFLKASGRDIRNGRGQGDAVPLRGVNLGSWLIMEGWMCPMDSSGLADNYSVIQTLNNRFGVATQESLIKTYQNNWITTTDLDNIKALGMNFIRLPFWWGNVQRLDGTWRTDAFEKMDWLVTNAWQRGIYTLIDFHGVPGGQANDQYTGRANQNQYWSSSTFQNQTSLIWSNVAAHFKGNPAVAGYDLMNEPVGAPNLTALRTAYNNLYQAIRAVDPDHIIFIEGTWAGQGLNWEWNVLPPPTTYGWNNVVYEMHAYPGGTATPSDEINKQVSDFNNHQSWNVPGLIGEFNWMNNTVSDWQYGVQQFNQNNLSWCHWSYKATQGNAPNSWGIYSSGGIPKPNIQSDSSATISNAWTQCKTSSFGLTAFLRRYLGAPLAVADAYTNSNGGTLVVNSGAGVLANDLDINAGQSGISLAAVLVSNPTNGQLTLNANGSFSYTPNGGFTGTDGFRYRDNDGYVNSANIAAVSIQVGANTTLVPAQTRVETKADGTGVIVPSLNLTAGSTTNVFAIVRDAGGTFITNAAAAWSLQSINGGVISGDLVIAGGSKSAAFTGHLAGSAVIRAVANTFTGQSGTISITPGSATQLIWTTQPGLATNGFPFGQQPVLKTADQFGNPSTTGLAAALNGTVTLSAGTGPLAGTTNFNIGTTGNNGVVPFANLQINSPGTNKQLTAAVASSTNVPTGNLLINGDFNAGATGWTTAVGNGSSYATFEIPASLNPASPNYWAGGVGVYDGTTQLTLGATAAGSASATQVVSATSGVEYTLTVQAGAQNWWLPTGVIRLSFLNSGSTELSIATTNTTDSIHNPDQYDVGVPYKSWSLSATAPAGTTTAKVEFANTAGTGSTWFDNASLTGPSSMSPVSSATTTAFLVQSSSTVAPTNYFAGITDNGAGIFTLRLVGTLGARYYMQAATNLLSPITWVTVAGSTNTVTNSNGQWSFTVTNNKPQSYYRSTATSP